MTRAQLEHAIRAACDVADDTELLVFGSQAILGEHPNAPPGLRASIEVDVQPLNNPQAVDAINGALGELSMFHQTHGFTSTACPSRRRRCPLGGRLGPSRCAMPLGLEETWGIASSLTI